MTAINEALRHCEETGERWYYPELRRVRGEIALAAHQTTDAESWFVSALDHARRQGAGELERRAAASLDELQKGRAMRAKCGCLIHYLTYLCLSTAMALLHPAISSRH